MRPSLWHKVLALLRVPAIAWHLGRAGVLGHVGKITLLPNWMQRCCLFLDRLVRSRTATKDAGGALADALLRLGPGFVKFGQALSTRADLIGPEMSLSLSLLQDRLPAFHSSVAHRLVESDWRTTGQDFQQFCQRAGGRRIDRPGPQGTAVRWQTGRGQAAAPKY